MKKNSAILLTLIMLLVFGLKACGQADDEPPKHIKINPNRKEHYQAIIEVKNAPLGFKVVESGESYQATNCWYIGNRWAGNHLNPIYDKSNDVIQIDTKTYQTDFYADTPLNEDYYGAGLCKWQFLSAGFIMKPTGIDKRETVLVVNISPEYLKELTIENSEINKLLYYKKEDYPIATDLNFEDGWNDFGVEQKDLSFTQGGSMEDLFTVELTIRRLEK